VTETDRVLASIDEAIDGYVSEDWSVGDDAMRWRPEEPEPYRAGVYFAPMGTPAEGSPAWAFLGYLTEDITARLPGEPENRNATWDGASASRVVVDECQMLLVHRFGGLPFWEQALDLSWCNWAPPAEEPEVEPHWDDSLEASLERTRSATPGGSEFWSNPRAVARAGASIDEAMRTELDQSPGPLSATWLVNVENRRPAS
jgi:hypothetical protein